MGPLSRDLLIKFFNIPFVRRQFHYFLSDRNQLAWLNRRIRFGQIYPCYIHLTRPALARDLDFILVSHFSYEKDIWPRVGDNVIFIEPKRTGKAWAPMRSHALTCSSWIAGFEGYCGYMKTGRRGLPDLKVFVPRGHIWTQHDGPAHISDSRLYGPVPLASLLGKVIWRLRFQDFYFIERDHIHTRSTSQSPTSTTGQPIPLDAAPQSPGTPPDLFSETIPQANTSPKARLRYSASSTKRQESIGRSSSKKTETSSPADHA